MRHAAGLMAFVSWSMHAVRVLCAHNKLLVHVSSVQPIKLSWCANIYLHVYLIHFTACMQQLIFSCFAVV